MLRCPSGSYRTGCPASLPSLRQCIQGVVACVCAFLRSLRLVIEDYDVHHHRCCGGRSGHSRHWSCRLYDDAQRSTCDSRGNFGPDEGTTGNSQWRWHAAAWRWLCQSVGRPPPTKFPTKFSFSRCWSFLLLSEEGTMEITNTRLPCHTSRPRHPFMAGYMSRVCSKAYAQDHSSSPMDPYLGKETSRGG